MVNPATVETGYVFFSFGADAVDLAFFAADGLVTRGAAAMEEVAAEAEEVEVATVVMESVADAAVFAVDAAALAADAAALAADVGVDVDAAHVEVAAVEEAAGACVALARVGFSAS